MIVSMIVGILSTVTGFAEEPAEVLVELNLCLCGRIHDGFATCLMVRREDRGSLVPANAGHLSPYLNGTVRIAGSMPLGLAEDCRLSADESCDECRRRTATLLTDGIVEAQNQELELLGFLRVESLLRSGASAIVLADTVQQFGQNDDLTVIRILREA